MTTVKIIANQLRGPDSEPYQSTAHNKTAYCLLALRSCGITRKDLIWLQGRASNPLLQCLLEHEVKLCVSILNKSSYCKNNTFSSTLSASCLLQTISTTKMTTLVYATLITVLQPPVCLRVLIRILTRDPEVPYRTPEHPFREFLWSDNHCR